MPSVTSALNDPKSPASIWLARDYPDTIHLREIAREACGPILVPPVESVDRPALGSAFDMLATLTVKPASADTILDRDVDQWWTPNHQWLARTSSLAAAELLSDGNRRALYKMTWVLGLLVNSVRTLDSYTRSEITAILRTSTSSRQILAGLDELITADGLQQLRELDEIAQDELYPHLREPIHVHANLTRSGVQAEADIIADGVLLDLKTSAGTEQASGGYRLLPPARDIHQLIAYYVMAATPERRAQYGPIRGLGFYFARYGALIEWPAGDFLASSAGA